jgi:hypothetical protein
MYMFIYSPQFCYKYVGVFLYIYMISFLVEKGKNAFYIVIDIDDENENLFVVIK